MFRTGAVGVDEGDLDVEDVGQGLHPLGAAALLAAFEELLAGLRRLVLGQPRGQELLGEARFAGARLTGDQNMRVGAGNAGQACRELLHLRGDTGEIRFITSLWTRRADDDWFTVRLRFRCRPASPAPRGIHG